MIHFFYHNALPFICCSFTARQYWINPSFVWFWFMELDAPWFKSPIRCFVFFVWQKLVENKLKGHYYVIPKLIASSLLTEKLLIFESRIVCAQSCFKISLRSIFARHFYLSTVDILKAVIIHFKPSCSFYAIDVEVALNRAQWMDFMTFSPYSKVMFV